MSTKLRDTLHSPRVAELVKPHQAGRLVNQVSKLAEDVDPLLPWNALPIPPTIFYSRSVKLAMRTILSPATRAGCSRSIATSPWIVSTSDFAVLFP